MSPQLNVPDVPNANEPARSASPMIRTAAALLSVQGLSWGTSLIGIVAIPRLLGADVLGYFGSLLAVVALSGQIASMGTSTLVTREVARETSGAARLAVSAALAVSVPWRCSESSLPAAS